LLYNWHVGVDARNIANNGWHMTTRNEWVTLQDYYGGKAVCGGILKEIGLVHWNTPNTGATNESGFNLRGPGYRSPNFSNIKITNHTWTSSIISTSGYYFITQYNTIVTNTQGTAKSIGGGIRLVKDSTTLSHGETGTYTGNDGKIYRTICIGTQEWLADNLCETRFRNGDIIPWYGADSANYFTNVEWAALTTAGVCAYNNTLSNVTTGFTFPTE